MPTRMVVFHVTMDIRMAAARVTPVAHTVTVTGPATPIVMARTKIAMVMAMAIRAIAMVTLIVTVLAGSRMFRLMKFLTETFTATMDIVTVTTGTMMVGTDIVTVITGKMIVATDIAIVAMGTVIVKLRTMLGTEGHPVASQLQRLQSKGNPVASSSTACSFM